MSLKIRIAILIYFIASFYGIKAQIITLKGSVKDSLQNSLAYANVIAKPLDLSKNLQFSITDDDSIYKIMREKKDKLERESYN